MPKILKPTQFGNPILRTPARQLAYDEISSSFIQELIKDMFFTLNNRPYGVGLAAPQVGQGIALAIVGLRPTKFRPDREQFQMVVINPEIVETYGRRAGLWEGCISEGSGKAGLFAKALRYQKIRIKWLDEHGQQQEQSFEDTEAHVLQHEIDHLNGILFVDRVKDTTSYMTSSEYQKRIVKPAMAAAKRKNQSS